MVDNRNYIIERLKSRTVSVGEFNFDRLQAPPISSMFTQDDISRLYQIARSIRYAGNPELKLQEIDKVMKARGFVKFVSGTNRIAYRPLEDNRFLVKVAFDDVGRGDNPREFKNQFIFKPFVTKVFEVTPCGTLGVFERVIPITSREEFLSIAGDIYELINQWFIGEYVLEDIGTEYFLNWGIRSGFGPVLLDFPYVYKLDGNKLYCNAPSSNTPSGCCEGIIDYDPGFNHLFCTKCGVRYKAKELEKAIKDEKVIVKAEGEHKMKVSVKGGSKNLSKTVTTGEYADLAKKTPTKPILGRENMMSNTQIKAEQKESKPEVVVEEKKEIRDARREVKQAISIDPNFKSIESKFADIAAEIKGAKLSKKSKDDIINNLIPLAKAFNLIKDTDDCDEIISCDFMIKQFEELKITNEKDLNKFIEFIMDSLNLSVNFKSLYFNKENSQVMYETELIFKDPKDNDLWSTDLKLAVDPLGLLDPLYEAGYKINSDDNCGVEFTSGSEFSGDFEYFAAKVINVKDINQDLQTNKVITILNDDGEYLTLNGNILAVDMIDDRSVQSVSIVSKQWLDGAMKHIDEANENDNTTPLPTGVVSPIESEKTINGVVAENEEE